MRNLPSTLLVVSSMMVFAIVGGYPSAIQAQQNTDPCRFYNVKGWTGSFTLTGTGSGATAGQTYVVNQSISGSFKIKVPVIPPDSSTQAPDPKFRCNPSPGTFRWDGDFSGSVSINDRATTVQGISRTFAGSGSIDGRLDPNNPLTPGSQGAELVIDAEAGDYSLKIDPRFLVQLTEVSPDRTVVSDIVYFWGPRLLPDGMTGTTGLAAIKQTLPSAGMTLTGSQQYTAPGYPGLDLESVVNWQMTWTLTCDCDRDLRVAPYLQYDPAWKADILYNSGKTIGAIGCALTSLTMAVNYAYELPDLVTPGYLNLLMTRGNYGFSGSMLVWEVATRKYTDGSMKFYAFKSRSTAAIQEILCKGFPVVVGVNLSANGTPAHFVIVTGKQGDKFLINDPGFGKITLDQYPSFETRGYVAFSFGNPLLPSPQATSDDTSSLNIAADNNIELLVIDANGRRTGFDPSTGVVVEEIPGSVYFREALQNAATGEPPSETNHLVQIDTPAQGTYQVIAAARQAGPYSISVFPISRDGTVQTPTVIQGTTLPGASTLQVQYNSAAGTTTQVGNPSCAWISGSPIPFTPTGGTGTLDVIAAAGCSWTATSNASWLTISPGSGSGNGKITYTVAPTTATRSGILSIGGQSFNVVQAGTSAASMVQLSSATYSVAERGGKSTITVTRIGDISGAATIDYSTSDNEAHQRTDYTIAAGTLRFTAGETSRTFEVLVTDDAYFEGEEVLNLTLSNPTGAGMGSPGSAMLAILDDTPEPATSPIDAPGNYVSQHYHDFLNREPDAAGLAFWTDQIASCGNDAPCIEIKRINVSAAYFLSIEFQRTGYLVYRFYNAALNRSNGLPRYQEFLRDTQGVGRGVVVGAAGWEAQLEANKVAYANEFVASAEFTTLYPLTQTPAEFVDALYGRAGIMPTAAERQAAIDEFSTNPSTAQARVLRRVAEHPTLVQREFNRAFVLMQYFGYLRRNPDDAPDNNLNGYNFWLGKLNQFNGDFVQAEMVKAFIQSGEYRRRFGQ